MKKRATTKRPHHLAARTTRPNRRTVLKRRVRAAQPVHIRLALHPLSIFMLLIAGVLMIGWTLHVGADSYTVTAKVPAPPLTEGAVITSPADGAVVTTSPITVSGTCPDNSYVKLMRNNLFSGVSACAADNTFTISTALSPGGNMLVAQDYNITDDPGPATPGIVVHYNPPQNSGNSGSTTTSSSTSSSPATLPLLIVSDYRFQAVATGSAFQWVISLKGGVAPYTVVVDWGDGGETVQITSNPGNLTISHVYARQGYYTITILVTDATGATTTLQLVAFVKVPGASGVLFQSGNPTTPAGTGNLLLDALTASKWLLVAWPAYVIVVLMIASFWLGERQELRQLFAAQKLRTHPSHR